MFSEVTGMYGGNGSHMIMNSAYTTAKTLMKMPAFPRRNGPYVMLSPRSFARRMKKIGRRYDMYSAMVDKLKMAKRAVVEPMLMSWRRTMMVVMSMRELKGIRSVG